MNMFIDELLCFVEGWFVELTQVLFLELSKEVLDRRIVPAVGASRHGRCDVILAHKDIQIGLRSVLVPLVTVEDQSI